MRQRIIRTIYAIEEWFAYCPELHPALQILTFAAAVLALVLAIVK